MASSGAARHLARRRDAEIPARVADAIGWLAVIVAERRRLQDRQPCSGRRAECGGVEIRAGGSRCAVPRGKPVGRIRRHAIPSVLLPDSGERSVSAASLIIPIVTIEPVWANHPLRGEVSAQRLGGRPPSAGEVVATTLHVRAEEVAGGRRSRPEDRRVSVRRRSGQGGGRIGRHLACGRRSRRCSYGLSLPRPSPWRQGPQIFQIADRRMCRTVNSCVAGSVDSAAAKHPRGEPEKPHEGWLPENFGRYVGWFGNWPDRRALTAC